MYWKHRFSAILLSVQLLSNRKLTFFCNNLAQNKLHPSNLRLSQRSQQIQVKFQQLNSPLFLSMEAVWLWCYSYLLFSVYCSCSCGQQGVKQYN